MQNKKEDSEMVKAEQGSRRTGRKRGRRGGLRDPAIREMVRNGKISLSAELTPETMRRGTRDGENSSSYFYRRLWLAQMETLINYFDEDWFDFEYILEEEYSGTRSGSAKTPYRCPICDRPWSSGEREQEYYRKSFFNNIPMEKSVCRECDNALPAGAN